ncbi:hypothetical protein AciX8_3634 [Granulicella mallensis MP5ACTX8]|uniref:Peptidase A2 domain-containing protein n=2 Tax=Granulicella mallensis TaxID=940614 RepID=G8NYF6_GRAMM|nr:hypothetical protein AciX8_3634 [Granulicella mallensis MP5ACTX8]
MKAQGPKMKPAFSLPFVDHDGYIIVSLDFNKAGPKFFLVDTGVTDTVLDSGFAEQMKLDTHEEKRLKATGGFSHDVIPTRVVDKGVIHRKGLSFARGPYPVFDMSGFSQFFEIDLAGILGYPLFGKYVVEINYDTKSLDFFKPKKFKYQGAGQIFQLKGSRKLIIDAGLTLNSCQQVSVPLFLDTGSNDSLQLDKTAQQKYGLPGKQPLHPNGEGTIVMGGPEGTEVEPSSKAGKIKSLQLGSYALPDVETVFAERDTITEDSVWTDGDLGVDVLSQFNIIVNKPNGSLILEPRKPMATNQPQTCVPLN